MPSMLHQRITAHKNAHRDRKLQRALRQRDSATTSILKSLAIVVGVPFLLAVLAILVPLSCLRWRDQRRMRQLDRDLGHAHDEIVAYRHALTQALRSSVRDVMSRPATALQSHANRPGTALNRVSRAVGARNGRVHPAGQRLCF